MPDADIAGQHAPLGRIVQPQDLARKPTDALEEWIKARVYWTSAVSNLIWQFDRICLVWVTVVLLGGFASTLGRCDFWFASALLLLQGVRYLADMSVIAIVTKSTLVEMKPAMPLRGGDSDLAGGPKLRAKSTFVKVTPEAASTLKVASTGCYWLRFLSFAARLFLAVIALVNITNSNSVCHQPPLQRANSSQQQVALMGYYSMMILAAAIYFAVVEAWGWYWQIAELRQKLSKLYKATQPQSFLRDDLKGSGRKLVRNHMHALRYTFYLYFKAHAETFTAMLTYTERTWQEGPEADEIVLPWPWVEAAGWAGCWCSCWWGDADIGSQKQIEENTTDPTAAPEP